MSNLGWYQILTTMAKKVGGPKNLIALLAGGGALLGGGAVAGGNAIKKKVSSELEKKRQAEMRAKVYTVKRREKQRGPSVFGRRHFQGSGSGW